MELCEGLEHAMAIVHASDSCFESVTLSLVVAMRYLLTTYNDPEQVFRTLVDLFYDDRMNIGTGYEYPTDDAEVLSGYKLYMDLLKLSRELEEYELMVMLLCYTHVILENGGEPQDYKDELVRSVLEDL